MKRLNFNSGFEESGTFTKEVDALSPRLDPGVTTEVVCSLMGRSSSSGRDREYDHTGGSDQVGNAVIRVRGASPAPAPAPADDHGGSRSSATRIPDGSGENGVIGTADDIDVFSFSARRGREYTIETSLPSGSGVDTLIVLTDDDRRLDSDNNGGAGRASRIRWTAPSSATYYVAVVGVNDSTGAYRLSLSSRAPTRPPVARLSTTSVPGAAEVGRAFDVRVELRNTGGDGERGGVSVSFPTLSGGSKSSRDFTSSRADVRVVDYGGTGNVSLYKAGDSITRSNGATMSARHLLIESDDSSWRANTRRALTLRVTPKTAGSLRVMIRGWICADGYSNCSRDPASGRSDQQGYGATVKTVMVSAPAPADDHSDDISSATRISVGSGAPGVIGTASDADYFSFQARSGWEYAIETSVASGSNVDTVIVVSDDNNRFLEHDDNSGAGRASRIRWTAPSSATYYVIVWGGNGSTGAYRLSLSSRAPTPADDHGDDRSSATGISTDSSENGVIGTADDADYFSFQARRGWEYEIETSVASGSGVDTLIMLVDGGDRLLESDDNGGAGRASKMVWTAPSSATYYVVVVGRNDSTGAYRLSVSPRPLTFALLSTTSVPSSAEVGRSFDVHVELRNYGGDGERGGVSVSFPTLSGGSKSSSDFTSSRADVRVVSYTGGMGNVSLYKSGDSITRLNGASMSARHLLIESDDPTWPSDASRALTLRVTPKSAGSLRVMIRGWICADGYSSCSRYPMSGQSDQQGYRATVKTVNVSAPQSARAQPGKLQVAPIGGLTAYLNSDGTDASGILSANYTLTNRVPNGETVRWAASSDRSWITVSPSSGSLRGGQSATVNVSINQRRAANLPVGAHASTVAFTNRTNGDGDSTRTATFRRLNTNANPADSEPVETLRLSRPESVAYRAAGLEEAWRQMAYMSERGLLNPVDIAVIDSGLWRPPAGSSVSEERIVRSEFDWNNINANHAGSSDGLQSSRHGYAVTSIIAAVNHAPSGAPDPFSFSGVVASVPGLEYHMDFYAAGSSISVRRAINRAASSSPDVVNMSMGNGWCNLTLGDILCDAAHGAGAIAGAMDTIFVIAAGNNGWNARWIWPASIDEINAITVAATDPTGNSRGFWDNSSSNHGPKIDIAAPSGIHAVNPQTSRGVGVYNPFEGTSSAAPLVSGVVALLRAIDPNVTALDVKELLRRTGNPITVCVAGGDLSLAQCPADKTEDWIVMDAGAAVKHLMRHRGIPLAPADYAPTPAPAQPQPAPTAPTAARNGPIVFASYIYRNREIHAMNADGSGVTRLTNNLAFNTGPSWSSDGRRIAFASNSGDGSGDIYVMNADGTGVTRLTNNSAGDWSPSWSPDGRRIAFNSNRSGNLEIYAMNADGTGVTRLTNNSAFDWNPSWSPDGRRIAFNSNRSGSYEIYAMNADGSGVTRLANRPNNNDYRPRWSPDGGKIAFYSYHGDNNTEIYVMNADGSGVARLTNNSAHDNSPSWSPDGRRIAFASERSGNYDIYAMNVDGTDVVRITNNPSDDTDPSWGPSSARFGGGVPAPAAPADDHGGSRSSATRLARVSDGSSVSGNIETAGDEDYFAFQAERGAEYTIETRVRSGLDTVIELYSSGGSRLGSDDDSGDGAASKLVWMAPSSGTYYVKVKGYSRSETGAYELSLSVVTVQPVAPAPAADDHGDTRSSATRISVGRSANGVIETAGDPDYFSFQAERGREYTIETSIPSSSNVDTFITLYRSNGSSLGENDDGGDGYASKLVWTAPSSGTYYVKVDGLGESTGGYRLSVSARVETPTPAPAPAPTPVADIGTISTPREATVGQSFDISVELANDGGAGGGGISISFPSLTGGSASSGRYTSAAADVQAVNASAWEYVSMYKSGDRTYDSSGRIFSAEHLLVEAIDDSWRASSERTLRLRVTPKRAGDFDIRIRGWICADAYCSFDPESGTRDQQGHEAIVRTVNVAAPAPADDHGDTRSSATRISVGRSANGVIETAGDPDYFSFQAERGREYTIETSIPSSSDVDTFVTLYRSNGSSLGENDDGGGGYASKLVWTAPSSGTYYVKVDGLGDSTGGYRLSLSARVETPTPAPAPPVADVGTVSTPREATVGQSFDISVELANDGGAGNNGGISISFPSLTGGSESSGRYTSSAADVQAVNAGSWDYVSMYKSGDRIYDLSGRGFSAEHLLVEATDDSWASSSERTLRLRVTPKRAGDFDIRIRGWICADSNCSRDPESGTRDQQGQRTILRTVNVAAPAPTESLSFTLTRGSLPNSVEVGESFEVEARVHRLSGEGERGGISISFPSLTGGRAYADRYTSAAADVHEDRSNGMEVFVYREGDAIDNPSLPETPARHLQFESDGIRWSSSTDRTLRLRVTPKRAGEIPIRIRAWVCADGYSQCARSPVDGVRDQQGMMAMSASVAVVAPAPTPAPAPAAEVGSISIPREAEVGESFDIRIELGNGGGAGNNGGISVSFPTLSGGSESSGRYTSSAADVQAVNAGAWDDVSMYKSGDSIYGVNGRFSAEHLLVEASDDSWSSSTDRVLRLRVTPKRAGDFPIRIRAWICSDTSCSLNPASGPPTDQQGRGAMLGNVTVRAPAPTPAPDAASGSGGRISFTSNRDGNWEIYAMNADGSGVVRLTRDSAADGCASWSSDGRRIAFESTRDGYYAIYAMNADGSNQTRLTSDSADGCPVWSPDGRRIAFQSYRDGNGEIYAMNADGSNQTRLTNNDARDRDPAWSPDGRRIAFSSERDGNSEIYVMNADGSGLTRITNNSVYDGVPAWSPDGRRIAFGSRRDGNSEIYVMNADGSGVTRITNSAAADWYPSWSPDGRRIAFSSQAGGSGSREIYAVNADGSGVTRITNNSDHDSYPSWGR